MPQQGQPWTQEEWTQAQTNNPEQWGNYVAISGDQYGTPEQQGWWQNVQQVGQTGTPGSGLYGLAGTGTMPGTPPPPEPPAPPEITPTSEDTSNEDINIDENTDEPEDTISEDQQALIDAGAEADAQWVSYTERIEDLTADLEEYNQQYIEEIKRSFGIRKAQMEQLNKATLAGKTKAGIRAGRQRYATDIHADILTAEESAGISRLAELDAQESMLIAEARMAMTEKKMDLLDKQYAAIQQRQEEKRQLLLDLRNIAIQEEERAREKMRFQREKASWAREDATTRLESMFAAGLGLESLTDEDMDKFEADLGLMAGTFEGFYKDMQDAQKAADIKDDIALQKSIIDLLNATPDNMEITIGDSTYKGLKDNVDRYIYTEIKGNTKYEVAIDKKTGQELWRKSAGQAYKPTSGPAPVKVTESLARALGIPISYIGTAIKDLPQEYQDMVLDEDTGDLTNSERKNELINYIEEKNLIGDDNKVSWETYLAMQQTWINNNGTEASFKTNFPVGTWLDEDNQEELATQLKGE
jgi:hypothetical protein